MSFVKKIAEQMEKQISDGAIELESLGQQIIIRIRENGYFPFRFYIFTAQV